MTTKIFRVPTERAHCYTHLLSIFDFAGRAYRALSHRHLFITMGALRRESQPILKNKKQHIPASPDFDRYTPAFAKASSPNAAQWNPGNYGGPITPDSTAFHRAQPSIQKRPDCGYALPSVLPSGNQAGFCHAAQSIDRQINLGDQFGKLLPA